MESYLKDEIIRLYSEGFSYRQIEKILSCSKGTISYHLGEGQKEKARKRGKHSKAVRRATIGQKKMVKCMDCGFMPKRYSQMDFDHRDGVDKVDNINNLIKNGSWEQIYAEIEKCDLVCANCHRLRTDLRYEAKNKK